MKMILGGEWTDRETRIPVEDPYDGSTFEHVPAASGEDVRAAIAAAVEGYRENRDLPAHRRVAAMLATARHVEERAEEFARTIAMEGSKTINEARKEVGRAVNTLVLSAEEGRRLLGETIPFDTMPGSEDRWGYYYRFPIGVIAAITPFNDPLNLVAHKVGPALVSGNAVVVKPATVTPLSALRLGEALLAGGFPPAAVSVITGRGEEIGESLVSDPRVRMISFTGGLEAGRRVARMAGIKKIGMELGSNSPVIVLADADLERAVELTVSGAFWAAGQNCIGVQRVYIEEAVYGEFEERFAGRARRVRTGPKLDESTDMGPMISEPEARRVESWIREAVEGGARVLAGGGRTGAVVEPTVMAGIPEGAALDCQEVFGPVVGLYPVPDLETAIARSNAVDFGLHAAIFTQDIDRAHQAIRGLDVGGVIVNDSTDYRLDAMPFGGVKGSGLGREGIRFALQEMTEPKVVCFNLRRG
ncbi:MAG: aldehyde dehydrogenase family protein [Acidobacteriota bacterium]|jgi:glyceraldehyde-3-phosphate dehydrogenase (NADP+)